MASGGHIIGEGFAPEDRQSAWWATDSRRAVSGQLLDVLLEKRGEKERADLSGIEAVQMGIYLEGAIGRLWEEQTGISVRDLDIAGTHSTEPWLRAHGDFWTGDKGLLEVKNFGDHQFKKYPDMDDHWTKLPEQDIVQCIHEATVFDVDHIYFAVLFGGQRFRWWRIDVTPEMKTEFIQRAAGWWAMHKTGQLPSPETIEQAQNVYRKDDGSQIVADKLAEEYVQALDHIKKSIKTWEEKEELAKAWLMSYMGEKAELVNVAGDILVTWKTAKPSKRFNAKRFEQENPKLFEQYKDETAGSRRFLVK
jgi:predicted phage-related endonuclease